MQFWLFVNEPEISKMLKAVECNFHGHCSPPTLKILKHSLKYILKLHVFYEAIQNVARIYSTFILGNNLAPQACLHKYYVSSL